MRTQKPTENLTKKQPNFDTQKCQFLKQFFTPRAQNFVDNITPEAAHFKAPTLHFFFFFFAKGMCTGLDI